MIRCERQQIFCVRSTELALFRHFLDDKTFSFAEGFLSCVPACSTLVFSYIPSHLIFFSVTVALRHPVALTRFLCDLIRRMSFYLPFSISRARGHSPFFLLSTPRPSWGWSACMLYIVVRRLLFHPHFHQCYFPFVCTASFLSPKKNYSRKMRRRCRYLWISNVTRRWTYLITSALSIRSGIVDIVGVLLLKSRHID